MHEPASPRRPPPRAALAEGMCAALSCRRHLHLVHSAWLPLGLCLWISGHLRLLSKLLTCSPSMLSRLQLAPTPAPPAPAPACQQPVAT